MLTKVYEVNVEQGFNFNIVTLEECIYKYKYHKEYAVCSNGKLTGFVKEDA